MDEKHAATIAAIRAVALPDILSVEDLARALRVTSSAARMLLRAGRIPGKKLGRRWLVSRSELLRALSPAVPPFRILPQEEAP